MPSMLAQMSSPPQRRSHFLWIALALTAVTQLRLWPAWSGWHKDDDFRNLRWALAYRDTPWKALTELTPVHEHIRPATLWGHWLGAQLGDGSWAGIHAVHVVLCTGTVLGLFFLTERIFGWKEGLLAATAFLLLPGIGELPWWNAWMGSAGEVTMGLLGLWRLHADLKKGRWPIAPLLALTLAGLFKEPGWVIYPLGAACMALHQLRQGSRAQTWAAVLGFPALGLAGLALSYHPQNLVRADQGAEFVDALGALVDPLLFAAPRAGAGIAFPLPLLALGLWARLGLRTRALWVATAITWGLGLALQALGLSPGWLLLLGLPLALAAACWQWFHGARPPVDLLLALAGFGVMVPFSFPHPVQMLGGLAGLCMAMAAGWVRLDGLRTPWVVLGLGSMAVVASWARQEQPVRGEFPSPVSAQAKIQLLDALALAQSRGVRQAKLLEPPDDRGVILALGGMAVLKGNASVILDKVALGPGTQGVDLLAGLDLPRTNLRHKARPGSQPLFRLEPGLYVLSAQGSTQSRGAWVQIYGGCGDHSLTPGTRATEQVLSLHITAPCTLELRADTHAPSDIRLSSIPAPSLAYRTADPRPQQHFFQSRP